MNRKKYTSRLLLLMMALAMGLSMAACKRSDDNKENKTTEKTTEKVTEKATEKNDALYGSVEEYVNSDEMQTALQKLKESQSEGIDINIVAEGRDKMVYIFTYKTIAHTEGDGMTEALEAAIVAQDATFQQTANSVKPYVGGEQITVEIRYVDMNGAVIFSKTYVSE